MVSNSLCQFRHAEPQDVDSAVPLIYSSGTQAIEFAFPRHKKTNRDFLQFAFVDGRGLLGYRNHTVATINGRMVGIAAVYNLSTYVRLTLEHLVQLWLFYPARDFVGLVIRGIHLQSTMPSPAQNMHYLAHFGVVEEFRGTGIGTSLLDHFRSQALALGRTLYALDVSVENPRAQALYEGYGFSVTSENRFSGPRGSVSNTRRMTMPVSKHK